MLLETVTSVYVISQSLLIPWYLLFDYNIVNFGPFSRGEHHSSNLNHGALSNFYAKVIRSLVMVVP